MCSWCLHGTALTVDINANFSGRPGYGDPSGLLCGHLPPSPRAVVSFLPPFSEALAQAASRHDSVSFVSTRIASRALIGFRQQTWLADAVRPIQRVNMPIACPNLVRFADRIDPFSPPRGWPMTMHQPQLLRIDHPETPSRADNEFV